MQGTLFKIDPTREEHFNLPQVIVCPVDPAEESRFQDLVHQYQLQVDHEPLKGGFGSSVFALLLFASKAVTYHRCII